MRCCNDLCNYFWIKEWNIIGSKTPHYTCSKLRALLRRVFPNYISFTTSLTMLVKKQAHFMLMSSPSAHACATQDASVWLQLLASPLTKWNLPVPCKLGRETRCVLQNRNRIFLTSELSFTRGFMNELMTDWWRIIINNILPLPECILDYSFKLTWNHQGPYNSKMNRY